MSDRMRAAKTAVIALAALLSCHCSHEQPACSPASSTRLPLGYTNPPSTTDGQERGVAETMPSAIEVDATYSPAEWQAYLELVRSGRKADIRYLDGRAALLIEFEVIPLSSQVARSIPTDDRYVSLHYAFWRRRDDELYGASAEVTRRTPKTVSSVARGNSDHALEVPVCVCTVFDTLLHTEGSEHSVIWCEWLKVDHARDIDMDAVRSARFAHKAPASEHFVWARRTVRIYCKDAKTCEVVRNLFDTQQGQYRLWYLDGHLGLASADSLLAIRLAGRVRVVNEGRWLELESGPSDSLELVASTGVGQ